MGISAHVGHFEGLAGRKNHCRAWAFFRAFSKVVWAGPENTEFDYILGKKWDMSFLFGHKSGHFRRGRCRKKAKYWAFRAFSSKIVVGRMSGIFRQILGIFGANLLVTLSRTRFSKQKQFSKSVSDDLNRQWLTIVSFGIGTTVTIFNPGAGAHQMPPIPTGTPRLLKKSNFVAKRLLLKRPKMAKKTIHRHLLAL